MEVECVFFGPVREAAGTKATTRTVPEGTTVAELVGALVADSDDLGDAVLTDDGDLRQGLVVTVNTRHVRHLDGESTRLSGGDTVRFTAAIQGG